MSSSECVFCAQDGGEVLWRDARCRVVWPNDAQYPSLCRVVWTTHVKEMTDLAPGDRAHFMQVVFSLEAALRAQLTPDKINLASLGNVVPHLHWHVIARYTQDAHFPGPIWGAAQREYRAQVPADFSARLRARLAEHLVV